MTIEVEKDANPGVRACVALLKAVRLFGLLCWAYIAANSITHPVTMTIHLTHLANWPHENTFGDGAFVASLAAALTLSVLTPDRSESGLF